MLSLLGRFARIISGHLGVLTGPTGDRSVHAGLFRLVQDNGPEPSPAISPDHDMGAGASLSVGEVSRGVAPDRLHDRGIQAAVPRQMPHVVAIPFEALDLNL